MSEQPRLPDTDGQLPAHEVADELRRCRLGRVPVVVHLGEVIVGGFVDYVSPTNAVAHIGGREVPLDLVTEVKT